MSDIITAGSTSRSIFIGLDDASSSTGAGLSGIVAANLNIHYLRMETDNDGTVTVVTPSDLAAITTAYTSGGWKEMDVTNGGGTYRFDVPDGALAAGAWEVVIVILDAGSNNIAPVRKRIQLDPVPAAVQSLITDAITATSIAANAITDAKVASDVTIASVTGAVGSVTGAVGSVTGNVGGNVVGSVASVTGLTTTNITTAVWNKAIGSTTTTGQIMRYVWAYVMGKLAGANTATPIYYHPEDGVTPVITGSGVTSTGNRNTSTAG